MLKWIGTLKGVEGLPNIPARDLTDDDVQRYGGEAALVATGLYERPHEEPKKSRKLDPEPHHFGDNAPDVDA